MDGGGCGGGGGGSVCVCVCVWRGWVGLVLAFFSGPWVIFPPKCVLSLRKPLYQPPAGILKLPL